MKTLRYTKITRKRLRECLELVGWSIRPHGADSWRLYNPEGKISAFAFYSDYNNENSQVYDIKVDEFLSMKPFGKTKESYVHYGLLSFSLKDCVLKVQSLSKDGEYTYVGIAPKKAKNAAYISFMGK